MSFKERSKKILRILDEFESLSVMDIAQKLSISTATVRRDLLDLSKEGFLVRTHGGAMKNDDARLTGFNQKHATNDIAKQTIGKLAAENVKNGDIIFMDCGSTVFTICPHLKKLSKLKVITNSLPIVAELMNVPGISINLIGGELDAERKAVHGEMANQHIDSYHADKAFIGIDGFSVEKGLSSHSENEAGITKAFCRNADTVYLLCDSSKIGKDSYIKLGPVSMIDHLITDEQLSLPLKKKISAKGITVIQ